MIQLEREILQHFRREWKVFFGQNVHCRGSGAFPTSIFIDHTLCLHDACGNIVDRLCDFVH